MELIDQRRYAEWVPLSYRAVRFETYMLLAIQGLGRVDAVLAAKDQAWIKLSPQEREIVEASRDLSDRFTQSYLWVLGAYEIVRTIDQRVRENPSLVDEKTAEAIREAKHKFERVRIPLAKFEPAKRYSDTDSSVAFPALDPVHGIAWCVADNVFVTRQELSDCFMDLLKAMPAGKG